MALMGKIVDLNPTDDQRIV